MSSPIVGRTSVQMSSNNLLSAMRRTQLELLKRQQEVSSGLKVERPSDSPADVSVIEMLQGRQEDREQWDRNLQHALSVLDVTDAAIGDVSDILLEAKTIASDQIGIGSDTETRKAEATVIDAQIQSLLQIVNREASGIPLFGGNAIGEDNRIFSEHMGGIRYLGSDQSITNLVGLIDPMEFNGNGKDALGALSSRVVGQIDLDPQLTANTRLVDVHGAQGRGVRLGQVEVVINGGPAVTVDLRDASTAQDVITRVNNTLGAAGSLGINGAANGFALTVAGGNTVEVRDLTEGETAGDLGIRLGPAAGPTVVNGSDIDPKLHELTDLASFGPAVDWLSGLKITQGNTTRIADFSTATTVQDLVNEIESLDMGLRLEVNDDGKSFSLITEISGIELSVGENAGGTTATDLGIRTFGLQTQLDDFQFGLRGVNAEPLVDDFQVELSDGTTFNVNLDGAATVQDVITIVTTAAESVLGVGNVGAPGAGATLFNFGLAQDGNGFQLEDNTAGGGNFRVVQLGQSMAAADLGIYKDAGASTVINGDDVVKVRVESVFTHLMALRDALVADDSTGITFAGGGIEMDIDQVARARAEVGVKAQRVARQQERSSEMQIAESSMLSILRDADLTETITRYTQLMQQLEASMRLAGSTLQTSLLDFLR